MVRKKLTNLVLGSIVGVAVVSALCSSAYAKVGDNPVEYQVMSTYRDVSEGKYATIYCNPGYTQVTATKSGYSGCLKYARYHICKKLSSGKYEKIGDEIKNTTAQPCYTSYIKVSDNVARRYHNGYIRMGTTSDTAKVQHYYRTVYKESK